MTSACLPNSDIQKFCVLELSLRKLMCRLLVFHHSLTSIQKMLLNLHSRKAKLIMIILHTLLNPHSVYDMIKWYIHVKQLDVMAQKKVTKKISNACQSALLRTNIIRTYFFRLSPKINCNQTCRYMLCLSAFFLSALSNNSHFKDNMGSRPSYLYSGSYLHWETVFISIQGPATQWIMQNE